MWAGPTLAPSGRGVRIPLSRVPHADGVKTGRAGSGRLEDEGSSADSGERGEGADTVRHSAVVTPSSCLRGSWGGFGVRAGGGTGPSGGRGEGDALEG